MENPLISVIVPVYNGEKFIDRVMPSLVYQCPDKIEIILVNDGSTDNSSEICHKYESNYFNVKVVDKKNGGSSTARNAGMKVALGDYISFVDVDDTMDLNSYEEISNIIKDYSPDIIDFGLKYVSRSDEITCNISGIKKNIVLDHYYIREYILPPLLNLRTDDKHFVFDFACNKVFKKTVLDQNKILFNENRRTWEDRIFVVEFLKFANSYYSIDQCFYNYMDVPNSLSRRYDLHFFDIIIDNYLYYYDNFSNIYDFNTEYVCNYWSNSIENMIYRSLGETSNKAIIDSNIKKTLQNEIVLSLYKQRKCNTNFEYKINNYIEKKNVNKALILYKRKYKLNKLKIFIYNRIINIKFKIKKTIKKGA